VSLTNPSRNLIFFLSLFHVGHKRLGMLDHDEQGRALKRESNDDDRLEGVK
jgi:hypothetical protein